MNPEQVQRFEVVVEEGLKQFPNFSFNKRAKDPIVLYKKSHAFILEQRENETKISSAASGDRLNGYLNDSESFVQKIKRDFSAANMSDEEIQALFTVFNEMCSPADLES